MQHIEELNHKFIEVSHFRIGIKLLKLWFMEVKFWVPILRTLEIEKNRTWKWVKFWTPI